MALAGIVLAGGAGRRLGRPKASVLVAGATLVERAVAALSTAGCGEVVVVSRPEVELPAAMDAAVVLDEAGPPSALRAVRTGLAAVGTDAILVLACDLPLAAPLVARLAAGTGAGAAVAVDVDGRLQPLCGRYPRPAALAEAAGRLAAGDARVVPWAEALGPAIEAARGDELLNVNDEADLARAEEVLARQHG